jgi:hypothetical protein
VKSLRFHLKKPAPDFEKNKKDRKRGHGLSEEAAEAAIKQAKQKSQEVAGTSSAFRTSRVEVRASYMNDHVLRRLRNPELPCCVLCLLFSGAFLSYHLNHRVVFVAR